jgi:hypothetical protein
LIEARRVKKVREPERPTIIGDALPSKIKYRRRVLRDTDYIARIGSTVGKQGEPLAFKTGFSRGTSTELLSTETAADVSISRFSSDKDRQLHIESEGWAGSR